MAHPHIIYVITGQCGEYSDHSTWNVCWRMTEDEAKAVVEVLNGEAVEAKRQYNDSDYDYVAEEKHRKTMADPYYRNDYTGTTYSYEPLADDARALEAEKAVRP